MLRSTSSNFGSAIPIFVDVLGPLCFSSWYSFFRDVCVGSTFALHGGSAALFVVAR